MPSPTKRSTAVSGLLNARDSHVTAIHLLTHPEAVEDCLKHREFGRFAAFLDYVRRDAPESLAATDVALYRQLRSGVTEARIKGFAERDIAAVIKRSDPRATQVRPGVKFTCVSSRRRVVVEAVDGLRVTIKFKGKRPLGFHITDLMDKNIFVRVE